MFDTSYHVTNAYKDAGGGTGVVNYNRIILFKPAN